MHALVSEPLEGDQSNERHVTGFLRPSLGVLTNPVGMVYTAEGKARYDDFRVYLSAHTYRTNGDLYGRADMAA